MYERTFLIPAPAESTGMQLEAVIYSTSGTEVSVQRDLFWEYPNSAYYMWTGKIPEGHRGIIVWRGINGGAFVGASSVNPEETQYLDARVSDIKAKTDLFTMRGNKIEVGASGVTIGIDQNGETFQFSVRSTANLTIEPLKENSPILTFDK